MPEVRNIVEVKNTLKDILLRKVDEEMRTAGRIAAKVSVAFVGASLGAFLRELLASDEFLREAAKCQPEEFRAALRTALAEVWDKAYNVLVVTLKEGLRGGQLEGNIFAEKVLRHLGRR